MPTFQEASKYERIQPRREAKFYIMGLLSAYWLVGKQIPIKCYFIYYLNETTIYDLRKSKTILVSPYRVIAIISNGKVHWKSYIPPPTIL